jgi:hypothetical protein
MATYYAWTEIRYGGEVEQRPASGNRFINVVTKRNIVARGDKVAQKDLGVSDEEWQTLIDGGSVREYPLPEGSDDYTSPAAAVTAELVDEDGNIDVNKLVEMGLAQPQIVAEEEEAPKAAGTKAEVPKGA